MATKKNTRHQHEQGMLKNIGDRKAASPSPEPAAKPAPSVPATTLGWMGYVGGALWATFLCVLGLIAWLFFAGGG